MDIIEEIFQED